MNFLKKKLFTDTRVLFYFFCSLLLIVFLVVQSRIWFGDYSFSNLQQLKNQITSLEKESTTLLKKNELLEGEKEKFSSNICLINHNKEKMSYEQILKKGEKISKGLENKSLVLILAKNHVDFLYIYN